jgi:hypothetical protein
MSEIKDRLLEAVLRHSEREAARLAGQFARAASEDKEAILAALEFEQWFSQSCRFCQNGTKVRLQPDS